MENVSDPVIVQFEVSMSQLVKVVSACQGQFFFKIMFEESCYVRSHVRTGLFPSSGVCTI